MKLGKALIVGILSLLVSQNCLSAEKAKIVLQLQNITDTKTQIQFKVPTNTAVENSDFFYCPTDKPISSPLHEMTWNIFRRELQKGDFKTRMEEFSRSLGASDGDDGGSHGKAKLVKTLPAASGNKALLFEIRIEGHGEQKKLYGHVGCYILAVELRKDLPNHFRALILSSYHKELLMDVAATIQIPAQEQPKP